MTKKGKKVNPLWGGRFDSGINELAQSFSASIDIDKRLFEADIKGSIAYAEVLKDAKLINASELSKIKKGLAKILKEIQEDKFHWDPALEDVHMNIESRLVKVAGAAAKKIHTGRSRNDQVATDLRLFLRDKIADLLNLLQRESSGMNSDSSFTIPFKPIQSISKSNCFMYQICFLGPGFLNQNCCMYKTNANIKLSLHVHLL